MLNRRILRVKVMQALYAFFQSPEQDLIKAQNALLRSIEKVYELYLYYLQLPVELARVAEVQMQEAKNKALPTDDDLNPNRKFVDSYLIQVLSKDTKLQRQVENYKISWGLEEDYLRKLWKKVKTSELYRDFLSRGDHPSSHRKFVEQIYKQFVLDDDYLYSSFQEGSIYWDFEDSDFAINMAIRYVGKIKTESRYKTLPNMFKEEEEDLKFVKKLFVKTIHRNEELSEVINDKIKNWDMDRIAALDVLFMKMAMIEFLEFSSIPVKVSINEYIELSKFFSTPKSKLFINGVLDKVLMEYQSKNKIKKSGRGLLQ